MHTLQALALPLVRQQEYVPSECSPMFMIRSYRYWLGILQGRDDWKPTDQQQVMLSSLDTTLGIVEEPKIAYQNSEWINSYIARHASAAREALDNDAWCAVRDCSSAVLTAFGWEHVTPPESATGKYDRLQGATVINMQHRYNLAIAYLELARHRPGMFFLGGIDGAQSFLWGYGCAITVMTPSSKRMMDYAHESQRYRGWKVTSIGIVPQMQERGWSEDAIIDELFCIEIDAISRFLGDEGAS